MAVALVVFLLLGYSSGPVLVLSGYNLPVILNLGVRSIRVFAKNMGDPYYEPTIVVHDIRISETSDKQQILSHVGHFSVFVM